MPLWSTSRPTPSPSTSYSSRRNDQGPPVLPPIVPLTPSFGAAGGTPTFLTNSTLSSSSKGKHVQGHDDQEEEDDPWKDGSDSDNDQLDLVKQLKISTTSPPPPPPPLTTSSSSTTTISPTSTSGGGGWFSSLGFSSSSSSSNPNSRSNSTNVPSTSTSSSSTNSQSQFQSTKTLRRQPSAKDVALALQSSNSPSTTTTSNQSQSQPSSSSRLGPGTIKRGGSYIAGVNQIQEEAVRVVLEEEEEKEKRKSLEQGGGQDETSNQRRSRESGRGERDSEDSEIGRKRVESSERERLKKSIREDVNELVSDPTYVLPRLRQLWLSPPSSTIPTQSDESEEASARRDSISSISSLPPPPSTTTTKQIRPRRRERQSSSRTIRAKSQGDEDEDDDEDDGPPAGYTPLNASSLSSTAPTISSYQRDYIQPTIPPPLEEEPGEIGRERRRRKKFLDTVEGKEDEVDLGELRKLSWGGIPEGLRPVVWMLLLGYLPSPSSRRATTLSRKRQDYVDAVKLAFSRGVKGLDGPIWHQISIDVPRTRPGVALWMREGTQRSLERILYVWAIRHPASGYVQGINDLVTPFFQVFLSLYIDSDPEQFDPSLLPPSALEALEADSFWCLSKLLDGIQDNYIFAQPGITRAVRKMEGLCKRVDAPLSKHLESEGVEFIQFAFRWMNCLLMRELSVKNIVRMWDTYLAEGGDAFSEFHLYVCLSFLVKWSEQLREMDFQSIIMFLQSLPTQNWTDQNTELLLSEAFMWSRTFEAR